MTEKQGSFHVHTFLKQVMFLSYYLFNKTAEKTTPSATDLKLNLSLNFSQK